MSCSACWAKCTGERMAAEKTRDYDAWLHWLFPNACNLNCDYCFNRGQKRLAKMPEIKIPELVKTLDATGKVVGISFSGGGEPFLIPNIVEACVEITKKNFVAFNTNLTSPKLKEFAEKVSPEKVACIHASLHIKELERTSLLGTYIENFLLCKRKGYNIIAEEIAYPALLSEAQKYAEFFLKKGIRIGFGPFIGEFNGKTYPESYTEPELKAFGLSERCKGLFSKQNKICNAGYNVGVVSPNGNINACLALHESLGNIYKKIKFKTNTVICPFKFCSCPLNEFDNYLFKKAISEAKPRNASPIH